MNNKELKLLDGKGDDIEEMTLHFRKVEKINENTWSVILADGRDIIVEYHQDEDYREDRFWFQFLTPECSIYNGPLRCYGKVALWITFEDNPHIKRRTEQFVYGPEWSWDERFFFPEDKK